MNLLRPRLIPRPAQVVAAAGNLAQLALSGSLADLRPMPRRLVDEGRLREVYHYRPSGLVPETGDPVLLVSPLAAPALCYDLRRGCSVVERLVTDGRPTYLVEYGDVSLQDRSLGMEHWIDEVVPAAIRTASTHAGNRPVHVVGWSLGGIFSLLTAADSPELPIASLTVLGTPVDVGPVPLAAPPRPLLTWDDGPITRACQLLGDAGKPLRWASQLSPFQSLAKPVALMVNADDADFLAQVAAVDRFIRGTTAYPGRSFGQLYHRFAKGNQLAEGRVELDDRTIELADIDVPVLVIAGATDGITPLEAVQPLTGMLTGAPEARLEVVVGGHLGMLTGRGARDTTWPAMAEWIDQWASGHEAPQLGTNPDRRHSSAASRALSQ